MPSIGIRREDLQKLYHVWHYSPISSIKGEVKKKHVSSGWNFSYFPAHLIERDLF